jgi:hypothetical protein
LSHSQNGERSGSGDGKKQQPLYAIVQYDFHAERPDELEAKAGEPIVVIAQSNHEWYVLCLHRPSLLSSFTERVC